MVLQGHCMENPRTRRLSLESQKYVLGKSVLLRNGSFGKYFLCISDLEFPILMSTFLCSNKLRLTTGNSNAVKAEIERSLELTVKLYF